MERNNNKVSEVSQIDGKYHDITCFPRWTEWLVLDVISIEPQFLRRSQH